MGAQIRSDRTPTGRYPDPRPHWFPRMTETRSTAKPQGVFASIIIAVYNDWRPLTSCLNALAAQESAPPFEVIVVDDGGTDPVPEGIRLWSGPCPFQLIAQPHLGTAAARNRGIRIASGELLVFIDADCIPRRDCIAELASFVGTSPRRDYFQLRLAGEESTLAGRAEELRLIVTQDFLRQTDGTIRFLNTAGFAIRRSSVDVVNGLFDERVMRGEDTILFARLLLQNQFPAFVSAAVVQHRIEMSIFQCLLKDVRSALLESKTQAIISMSGASVRVSNLERFEMLRSMWKLSKQPSIGRAACFLLIARQMVRFLILAVCEPRSRQNPRLGVPVDKLAPLRAPSANRNHEAEE